MNRVSSILLHCPRSDINFRLSALAGLLTHWHEVKDYVNKNRPFGALPIPPAPFPQGRGSHVRRDFGDLVAKIAARLKVPPRLKGMRRDLGRCTPLRRRWDHFFGLSFMRMGLLTVPAWAARSGDRPQPQTQPKRKAQLLLGQSI